MSGTDIGGNGGPDPQRTAPQVSRRRFARTIRRISRNTIYLNAGQVLAKIISFGYILALARWLTLEDFGFFNLVLAFLLVADIAADMGLARLIIRDLARDRSSAGRYLGGLLPVKLVTAFIAWVGATAAVWLAGYSPDLVLLTAIAGAGLLPSGLAAALDNALHARQRMGFSALAAVSLSIAQATLGTVVLLLGGGLAAVLLTNVVANVVHMSVLLYGVRRRRLRFRLHLDAAFAIDRLRAALPFAGIALLAILSLRAEILVLSWFAGGEEIGLYSAAAKFPEAAIFFPLMFAAALTPVAAQYHVGSAVQLNALYLWAVRVLLLLVLPGSMCVVVLAGVIVGLLFPDPYVASVPLLQVMFLAFPFAAVYAINSAVLFASDYLMRAFSMFAVLVIVQFALNIVLVPDFGTTGAAIAYLVTQLLASVVSTILIRRWFLSGGGVLWNLVQPALAAAAMGLVIWSLIDRLGYAVIAPALITFGMVVIVLASRFPISAPVEARDRGRGIPI